MQEYLPAGAAVASNICHNAYAMESMPQLLTHLSQYMYPFHSMSSTRKSAVPLTHLLLQVLQDLDKQPNPTAALEQALRGVFAGNIFDLGAAASAQRYAAGQGAGFHCSLDQLLPRPWVSIWVSID